MVNLPKWYSSENDEPHVLNEDVDREVDFKLTQQLKEEKEEAANATREDVADILETEETED